MKVHTLMKERLSSPARRLAQVFLIAALGLALLWLTMQAQPAKADPSLIYVRTDGSNTLCNGEYDAPSTAAPNCAVRTVRQGIISVTVGGTVIVRPGIYQQTNTINKALTLLAGGAVTITAPAASTNSILLNVTANDVTIDGFFLIVNRPQAVAAVRAIDRNRLTVQNCTILDSGSGGTFANTYLTTNAVGIAVLSTNTAVAETIVITNNRISISSSTLGAATRGIWLRQVNGTVANNEVFGLAHDTLIQLAYGGTTTVTGNRFRGAGVEVSEAYTNTNPIVISDNLFVPTTASFAQSLLISHNYAPVAIHVINNTFAGHKVGIFSAASRGATIGNNEFFPAYGATVFTHTLVNTAYPISGAQSALGGANSITVTNNRFQSSTAAGLNGTAIEIKNDNSKGAVDFNPIVIGGTSSAMNTFDSKLARIVWLGANVTSTNPAINAYWNDWGNTTIDVIEAKLYHQPDDSNLAKINFYSMTVAAAPTTQWADNVASINVTATISGFFTPGSGSGISFTASSGTFSPVLAATNGAGQAASLLTSPIAGQTTITATGGVAVNHPVTATTVVTFTPTTNLTIRKSNATDSVVPGAVLTYTITVTNTGLHPADNVVITDTLPGYTTFDDASDGGSEAEPGIVVWPPFDLDGYDTSATRVVTVTLDSVFPAGVATIANTAIVSDDLDFYPDDNTAQDVDTVEATPDLEIGKSDGTAAVTPGATLTYQIVVTNSGAQAATGVRLTDYLPAHTTFVSASDGGSQSAPGVVTWPTFALNGGGASVLRTVTVAVVTPFPADTNLITNTASVADDGSNGPDPTPDNSTAEDVDAVSAAPDLVVSKDDRRTVVRPGETLAYLVTITNTGNQNAAAVFVTDTLPISVTFLAASDGGVESAPGVVTWPAFALAGNGGRATRLVIVSVNTPLLAGVDAITNTVSAATRNEVNLSDNTAWDVDSVDAAPDLALTKTDGGVTTQPGATLVYTLTYANLGNQEATGSLITETVPANATFNAAASSPGWTCTDATCTYALGILSAGAAGEALFAVDIVTPLPAGVTQLVNTASLADDGRNGADPNPANNSATVVTPIAATPDLVVSKSDGVDTVTPGATLTYQIVVTNSGAQAATGVRLTDYLPAHTTFVSASDGGSQSAPGVVTWPTFALNGGGASVLRTVTVAVVTPFPADTNLITNTVSVTDDGSNGPDPTPDNNTAEDVDAVSAAPDLLLTKDDGLTVVQPGSTLIYRLVVTNTGNQLSTGIVLTDTLPAYTTFALASDGGSVSAPGLVTWPAFALPGGASTTRLLVVTVATPLPAGVTALTNTATLRDQRGFAATALDSDAVDANPVLVLDKANAITATVPGATVVYTLTLTNNGNQAATGVVLSDTLPAEVAFVAASAGGVESTPGVVAWPTFALPGGGASAVRTLTVAVHPTLPAGRELLINTAAATDDRGFAAAAHHADTLIAAPDLALAKQDGGVAYPGATITYTLSYTNSGVQGATGVVIAETVPANAVFNANASSPGWTCLDGAPAGTLCTYPVGDLAAGSSGSVLFAVRIAAPLPSGVRQIVNTASIADDGSNGADTDPTNNTADSVTLVSTTIDLVITKDDGGAAAKPGATLVYTLTYDNTGDQVASGVLITETVPDYTTFNALTSSPGWTCAHGAPAGTVCTYTLGDVIDGGTLRFAVNVVLPFPINVTEITNHVSIGDDGANGADANPSDNFATTVTPIITRPDLIASKSDGVSAVLPEQELIYTITVVNKGTQNATTVRITDTLPVDVIFVSASDGGAETIPGIVTWPSVAQVALDETITRTLTVVVNGALPAGVTHITNTVDVGDDGTHGPDLHPEDNRAVDVNAVGAMPDLVLDKTVNVATIYPNGLLVYTIHVENTGSQGATGVGIVDTLPANTQFVSASDDGAQSTPGVVTWPPFALSVGEQAVRTLTVQVNAGVPENMVLTNSASVSDDGANGIDPTPDNNADSVSSSVRWPTIYLPLVIRKYATGPDLIVDNVALSADKGIVITIKNQGQTPVTTALGFWVDLYINPSPAPTHVNQTWDPIAPYGAAWGVDREALPINPGQSRELFLYDIYYKTNYSRLPVALRAGDILYVQVDSFNAATTYGAILENHEMSGQPYNNIVRLTVDNYYPLNPITMLSNHPLETPESYRLPERR
ncbi:MAG TPA: hypothetical protein PKZ84_10440 [Anaerolineae bacterium]|nr:hypothetical protein [Anaerolineae bacterium]HQI85054.1 hypothetical protein [Anaerolineae bacterium]